MKTASNYALQRVAARWRMLPKPNGYGWAARAEGMVSLREKITVSNNSRTIAIAVVNNDATSVDADVLVLKYAQAHYGLDLVVSRYSPAPY